MEWLLGIITLCALWCVWVLSDIANKVHQIAKDVEWLKNQRL
jgi:hypothetical protein